ncbi:MAG: phosphohistidine phosphatase SixA [Zetaproteobacteria bacterium]|nr:MAG: phosphohistidine phosphatase SixA [Zetaproteobacteria bacterium]
MRVYLVQHGKACDERVDPSRPLTAEGRNEVEAIARFLAGTGWPKPFGIVHSGKLRAQQTAEIFAEHWRIGEVRADPELAPLADPGVWAAHLAGMQEDWMLVGHLPHLARLAGLLLCGDADKAPVRFRNGGVVCLVREDGRWALAWALVPELVL